MKRNKVNRTIYVSISTDGRENCRFEATVRDLGDLQEFVYNLYLDILMMQRKAETPIPFIPTKLAAQRHKAAKRSKQRFRNKEASQRSAANSASKLATEKRSQRKPWDECSYCGYRKGHAKGCLVAFNNSRLQDNEQ